MKDLKAKNYMNKKYNVILFDMDGTLADTDPLIVEAFLRLYRKYGHGKVRPKEEIYYFSGPPVGKTLKEEFPDYDTSLLLKEFHEISNSLYKTHIFSFSYCKETILDLIKEGFKLGVVTNKSHDLTLYALECVGLDNLFDVIIGVDDVDIGKPNPEGIFKALNELNENNLDKVLYVGDNKSDYDTAKNAGVHIALVKWGPRSIPGDIKPDFYFSSYKHLKEHLYE